MRLLYLDDRFSGYPLARAGGHRSAHSLFTHLTRRAGVECRALIPKRGWGSEHPAYDPRVSDFEALGIREFRLEDGAWFFDCGYPIRAVDEVSEHLPATFDEFRPDVVYCHSPAAPPLLAAGRERGIPALWYIRDTRPKAGDLAAAANLGVRLVTISEFGRDRIRELCGAEAEVVYSLIDEDDYRVEPQRDGYVTFINPYVIKGYEVFLGFAELLPEVSFLVVEAWPLGPDLEKVEARLATLPNVRFLRQQADVRDVYRQTRLLVVPSLVEEAGPRVVREAHFSGIPTVGSHRGAVAENTGRGGVIVEDCENPQAWAETIRGVLDDPERYAALCRAAWANARQEKFTPGFIVRRIVEICAGG